MASGHTDGHEKEPKTYFGPKHGSDGRGASPLVHSHSMRPKRSIKGTQTRHTGKKTGSMKMAPKGYR